MTSRKGHPEGPPGDLPDHLLRWSEALGRRVGREMSARLPDDFPLSSGRSGRLLQLVARDGMRVTDLARRASITKQALGQQVNQLELLGLVESVPDPEDRRVRLVRRTPEGDRISAQLDSIIATVEEELRAEVGVRRFDRMKQVMRDLGQDPGPG